MTRKPTSLDEAYLNQRFLDSVDARPLRILSEYLYPFARFEDQDVSDTIVFMSSARCLSGDDARAALDKARAEGDDVAAAERMVALSRYYEDARELARRLTEWSKGLDGNRRRFVVCSGGGPGVMEAANRGASEAKGLNMGLGISIPGEAHENPYTTRELAFKFHYFFMRKFWFIYLAKAVVFFPGGFGTLDELFEVLTLVQTGKLTKRMPLILYGSAYWDDVLDFSALVRHGTIGATDTELFFRADSVDDAFAFITQSLDEYAIEQRAAVSEMVGSGPASAPIARAPRRPRRRPSGGRGRAFRGLADGRVVVFKQGPGDLARHIPVGVDLAHGRNFGRRAGEEDLRRAG